MDEGNVNTATSNNLMFCVVKFLNNADDVTLSVVPISWLNNKETECYWPKTGNIRKLIRKSAKHEENWTIYPVKVYKKYVTYDEALAKEQSLMYTSNDTDPENLQSSRKRKQKKLLEHYDSSDSTDSLTASVEKKMVAENNLQKLSKAKYFKTDKYIKKKKWNKLITKFFDPNDPDRFINHISDSDDSSLGSMPEQPTTVNLTPIACSLDSVSEQLKRVVTPEASTSTAQQNQEIYTPSSLLSLSSAVPVDTPIIFDNELLNDSKILQDILQNVLSIKSIVTKFEHRLKMLEDNEFRSSNTVATDLLPQLPVQNLEDLKNLENLFQENEPACVQYLTMLRLIGGTNVKNAITVPCRKYSQIMWHGNVRGRAQKIILLLNH